VGIGGIVDDNSALRTSFDALFAVKPPEMPIPEAIGRAAELLEETVARNVDSLTAMLPHSPGS
jgi:glycerate kinase